MSIQEEIHKAMQELQKSANKGKQLGNDDLALLFITSLIEEEGEHAVK